MAEDADMRNELSDMQQHADQLADEVRATRVSKHDTTTTRMTRLIQRDIICYQFF